MRRRKKKEKRKESRRELLKNSAENGKIHRQKLGLDIAKKQPERLENKIFQNFTSRPPLTKS